jgi:hypothetical protein
MWTRRFLISLLLALTALSVAAAPRNFPANAKRGVMSASIYPQILINGQLQRLSPGAKIMSKQNTITMPSTMMNNTYTVNYTVDDQGLIDKVWILTDEELAQGQ